jgi:hypothetical protein
VFLKWQVVGYQATMDGCPYEGSSAKRVENEEKELEAELAELKLKIEENELVYDIKRPRNVR